MNALHQHLPANTQGRDFVVGDLHGCLDLLQVELDRCGFNPEKDRLFSVGDLIDRGPDSMGCLRLLREPWFFAVRGNHEDALLSFYHQEELSHLLGFSATHFFKNGGDWINNLDHRGSDELQEDLLPRVKKLPYVITVGEGSAKFHVVHAELMKDSIYESWSSEQPIDEAAEQILTDDQLTECTLDKMREPLTWGRRLYRTVKKKGARETVMPAGPLWISAEPMRSELSLTYVGHTPLRRMILHLSHLFIDRGAYVRRPETCLQLLNHAEVCRWNL